MTEPTDEINEDVETQDGIRHDRFTLSDPSGLTITPKNGDAAMSVEEFEQYIANQPAKRNEADE